ncbi:hypothetical protein [Teredinibacter turnerae]|uniref:hypothetical protein n=1 Tax=Teredinibacter turnerae TaxID=2426 RepID=UPI001E618BCA|nr:hypothetical protein [Teredinibacter turnerae]
MPEQLQSQTPFGAINVEDRAMFKKLLISTLMLAIVFLGGCAALKHGLIMKGQVVDVRGDSVTLCIGNRDGAKAGDKLEVMRSVFKKGVVITEEGESDFKLVNVGRVEIEKVINEHYATAKVITGDIKVSDVAELKK